MTDLGYSIVTIDRTSEYWPQDVTDIEKLWCAGNLSLLKKQSVSIVGTRKPTEKGKEFARQTVDELGHNYVIVSGLAQGIDATAHLEALAKGFDTIAVLATPINRFYPPEHEQLQKMIANKGLLVSQFEIGSKTGKYCFVKRNLLMSRISAFSVVAQANDGGGAVTQAKYTDKQDKAVVVSADTYFDETLAWPHQIKNAVVVSMPSEIEKQVVKAMQPEQPSLF